MFADDKGRVQLYFFLL